MNAPHCRAYIRSELKCTPHENTVCTILQMETDSDFKKISRGPLSRHTTTGVHCGTILLESTAAHYCWSPLRHNTTGVHCSTLLLESTAAHYCWSPLRHTTTGVHCSTLLLESTAAHYYWSPLPHTTAGIHYSTVLLYSSTG